jgi:predicted GH43/DUF377 family glycosyl hydrolase
MPRRPERPSLARTIPISLAAIALVATACSAGGGNATPSAAASGSVAATPSAAAPAFAFDGSTPVVTTDLVGSTEAFVNPGAVIRDGDTLHMYANVFTAWPGHVDVYHLTSTDGVTWTPASADPVFTSDDVPYVMPGADVSTGFVTDDGTWVLILESVNSIKPWAIGRATAPGPDGPWTVDPDPVLTAGASAAWDAGGLSWPSVVPTTDGWAMYYTGTDTVGVGGAKAIGMATSTDGKTWTKRADPVLGASATWELGGLDRPRVAVTPDGFAMVYSGRQLTDRGLAWSTDGVAWTRAGDQPVITQDSFPVSGKCWDAALLYDSGTLTYYLEIGGGTKDTGTAVFRATASLPAS